MNKLKEKVTFRDAVRWRGIYKAGEYQYKTKMKIRRLYGKEKNWSFNRLSANDRLNDQLQKQHKFIPQTFREFYNDVCADTVMILAAALINHPVSLTEYLSFLSENARIICIKLLRSSRRKALVKKVQIHVVLAGVIKLCNVLTNSIALWLISLF